MREVLEKRASTLIYNFLLSNPCQGAYLLPVNICEIVPLTFLKAGQPFEFIDISKKTLCLDEETAVTRIRKNPKRYSGMLFVHTYGIGDGFENFFFRLKKEKVGFHIIDDKALCIPDFRANLESADLTIFSTGYAKTVDIGRGGLGIIANGPEYGRHRSTFNEKHYEYIVEESKRHIKRGKWFSYHDCDWLDTSPIDLSVLQYKRMVTEKLGDVLAKKRVVNGIYERMIPLQAQLPSGFQNWRFSIIVNQKERLVRDIFSLGLFCSSHYRSLSRVFSRGEDRVARRLQGHVINLFNDAHVDEEAAIKTAELVRLHVERFGTPTDVTNT